MYVCIYVLWLAAWHCMHTYMHACCLVVAWLSSGCMASAGPDMPYGSTGTPSPLKSTCSPGTYFCVVSTLNSTPPQVIEASASGRRSKSRQREQERERQSRPIPVLRHHAVPCRKSGHPARHTEGSGPAPAQLRRSRCCRSSRNPQHEGSTSRACNLCCTPTLMWQFLDNPRNT